MNNIQIVLGTFFGDEGKGTTVQFLCKEKIEKGITPLVVRFSGGAQAGHRVIYKDIEHVCSLVGSGVLLGCPTYLGKNVMVNPISLMFEVQSLQKFGIDPLIYIDPRCRIIIPDDIIRNHNNQETIKDGTCGCGIYECFRRYSITPHLMNFKYAMEYPGEYIFVTKNSHKNSLFRDACKWVRKNCIIKELEDIVPLYESMIFEGSQGLLLDMENGFMPHCTPSKVGLNGIPIEYLHDAEVFLVMRSYLTRHGNGYNPVGEDFIREHYSNLEEPTNLNNGFQGAFKIGVLDLDLAKEAFSRHCLDNYQRMYNVVFNAVITHMDCSPYPDVIPAFFDNDKIDYIDIDKAMNECFRNISLNNTYLGFGPKSEIVLFNR
jgi:adenylosuccinate synthase